MTDDRPEREKEAERRSTRLRSVSSAQAAIIATASVDRYRGLAKELPSAQDRVLEIGCSTGAATRLIAASGAIVGALDVSAELTERLREQLAGSRNVTVAHLDGRNLADVIRLMPDPTLIFLDIGGNAQLDNVAFQLRQCLRAFRPRTIVVRSFEFAKVTSLTTIMADDGDEAAAADVEGYRRLAAGEANPLAADAANRLVDDGDEAVAAEAEAYGRLGAGDGAEDPEIANLLDLSRSSSVKNREFAARRLGCIDDTAALERLHEMADDTENRVRHAASAALTRRTLAERRDGGIPCDR